MISWGKIEESIDATSWNESLLSFTDYNIFQSYGWGELKRLTGWQPYRFIARNKNSQIVAMVQLLAKRFIGEFGVAWAPGGPVFKKDKGKLEIDKIVFNDLIKLVRNDLPRVLIRFNSMVKNNPEDSFSINQSCKRPINKINSGYSIVFELKKEVDILNQMSSKHRYYVKKSNAENIEWQTGNSDEDIVKLVNIHNDMVSAKGISSLKIDKDHVKNLRSKLGENSITIFTGISNKEPITSCMTLNIGKKSFYMTAATTKKGRDVSAAYSMFYNLLNHLRDVGIQELDFGGIDPASEAAAGVNHFKKGFGGEIVEYLGEWEHLKPEVLRVGLNFAIKLKGVSG